MKRWVKLVIAVTVIVTSSTAGAVAASISNRATNTVLPRAGMAAPRGAIQPLVATDPQTKPETVFVPVTPCRIFDTRNVGGVMRNDVARSFHVTGTVGFSTQGGKTGGCGIPTDASAVAIAFRTQSPTAEGYLRVWPYGRSEPTASALSWEKGDSLGDSSTQPITPGGGNAITAIVHKADTQLFADVTGYYLPQIQALIAADGAIDAGTPRVVDVDHAGTGFYYIDLDRPARECVPAAITYNTGYYASVGLSSSSTPNRISVFTWYTSTSDAYIASDQSFFLSVTC